MHQTSPRVPQTLLREKLRIRHVSPADREIEVELTIRNTGSESPDVLLLLENYKPGLSIRDESGAELGYRPTDEVQAFFRDLGTLTEISSVCSRRRKWTRR